MLSLAKFAAANPDVNAAIYRKVRDGWELY